MNSKDRAPSPNGAEPIDFVILWVDGSDPAWLAEKAAYSPRSDDNSATANRYRDWGLLRYWFRGVEKFAPWVRTVHFVTWGHLPEWLDTGNPKLNVVRHEDYIPAEYLPTFNSSVIELFLHCIPGLSERFVYFNDDMFLSSLVAPEDFFDNEGNPVESAVMTSLAKRDLGDVFAYLLLNDCGIINQHFSKREVVRRNWRKFFSPKVGAVGLAKNLSQLPYTYFSAFADDHVCAPHLKSTFEEVWSCCAASLEDAARDRFRAKDDVTQYVFKWWRYCQGKFAPRGRSFGCVYELDDPRKRENAYKDIASGRYKCVCVNDTDDDCSLDFKSVQSQLVKAFETLLPKKCRFEL